jgi:hypothetical protein
VAYVDESTGERTSWAFGVTSVTIRRMDANDWAAAAVRSLLERVARAIATEAADMVRRAS